MPLFKCASCGCIENTATGSYWHRRNDPICSECDKGEWHGLFPKEDADEAGFVPDTDHGGLPHLIKSPDTD